MKPVTLLLVLPLALSVVLLLPLPASGQHTNPHQGHQMSVEQSGVVMNENQSTLPRDCTGISRDYEITIRAGKDYAAGVPGMVFGMDEHEVKVEPCSRVTVTFINEDQVRHQWMVHGLPKYLYPTGMFHIEASGGQSRTGTFIVPGDAQTYLVHCDLAQHMEKGMRGQLVVGRGSGDLWAVPGVSDQFFRFDYLPWYSIVLVILTVVFSLLISLFVTKGT